jgi:hypothetical protein
LIANDLPGSSIVDVWPAPRFARPEKCPIGDHPDSVLYTIRASLETQNVLLDGDSQNLHGPDRGCHCVSPLPITLFSVHMSHPSPTPRKVKCGSTSSSTDHVSMGWSSNAGPEDLENCRLTLRLHRSNLMPLFVRERLRWTRIVTDPRRFSIRADLQSN